MFRLAVSLLALAQSAPTDHDAGPTVTPPALQAAPARPNPLALAQYNAKRSKTPRTAEAQWQLALWCEEHGLEAESRAALAIVVELAPSKDAAWKRLGCEKHQGQWMTPEQIEQARLQEAADKRWASEFKAIHRHIHKGARQDEARAALARVDDPRAIPSLYREFADRSPTDQAVAVQVLGQIRGPVSSKTLASLSVYGITPEVRRLATETLRGRDPAEYAGFLVDLLVEIIKYDIRPVAGPGSPGVLFVEGERFNVRRFYAPPAAPNVTFRPGDMITYDNSGSPVIIRDLGILSQANGVGHLGGSKSLKNLTTTRTDNVAISPRQLQAEALKGAYAAQTQLENDIARIESQNLSRKSFNGLVTRVLEDATGQSLGSDADAWKTYSQKLVGYGKAESLPEKPKPTLDLAVPLLYQPRFAPTSEWIGFLQTPPVDT